jgi:hypothetical protein
MAEEDEFGQYNPDAGSPHPIDPDDVSYTPCNAVLRHTWSRYGERRYCSALALENFHKHGEAEQYEHPEFCRHHQSRASLMEQHEENFKTGAYAKSHEHTFQRLPPHKQVLANDLYKSLLTESTYNFETEAVELNVDVENHDFAGPEVDTLILDHPIPTDKAIRGKALWHAALDFITMESIREEQFRVAAEETSPDGRSLAIGETTTIVTVTDEGREVRDTEEHHLNLPLSRIQSNYQEHLKFGGVQYDTDDGETSSMGAREWVAVVGPEEDAQPETKSSDGSPLDDIEMPDNED